MRNSNTHTYEVERFRAMERKLRYDGSMPFDEWQRVAKAKLYEIMGLDTFKSGEEFIVEYVEEYPDFTEYRFLVETEPTYYVPAHLLLPKNVTRPPLTICLSGHGGGMHVALGRPKCEKDDTALRTWVHRNMARRSLNEGRAALVIESRSFGECSLEGYGTSCTEAAKIARSSVKP